MVTVTLAGSLCVGAMACAGDWPQFRGPAGQGIAEERAAALPLTWSESENVRWKVPVEGLAWSSPSIVGGRVYLTTATAGELPEAVTEVPPAEADPAKPGEPPKPPVAPQTLSALCLDADTGAELWRVELFEQSAGADIHDKNSHASPTPIVDDGKVYVHFGPHGTACLTTDGDVIWRNDELRYGPRHGTGSSPALAGDVLIVPCDGIDLQYVVGLEASSGVVRWKVERNANPRHGFSFCTPLVIEAAGRTQAICPGSSAVVSYDPATGTELWRAKYGSGYSVVPRPVFAHGLVYVCTGFGTSKLMAIDPAGSGDVTDTHVRWET
jgi:outer membrane protein assembly factor BamB